MGRPKSDTCSSALSTTEAMFRRTRVRLRAVIPGAELIADIVLC